ncbi:flagellar filament capping protein FliD [Litchfieldella xinjiangensis]|uniref:flagellar filament capping protein FliD n=1 Tax=Litchfieldella xinjiangensis TaxID=1166948 RepID=UPI0005BCD807|nr:flagellar filament capping protein FliD [Halomonas xinjiangensis]
MATISALGVGSGLDLNGLLTQLRSAERQKLTPIVQQQQSYKAKISAFGKLESALTKFQTSVNTLNDAKSFKGVTSQVTGSSITAASNTDAPVGRYEVNVTSLAKASSVATNGVDDKTRKLGAGSVDIVVGSKTINVEVTEEKSSLEGIRDAINAKNAGISASIINDGTEGAAYRLVLASTETGTQASISSVTFNGLLGLEEDTDTKLSAVDAELEVNGIKITSQTNRISEAIQGVTLDLNEMGASTLTISRDDAAIKESVKGFVESYNALNKTIKDLTKYNAATDTAGGLIGNSTVRSIASQLRSDLTSGVEEGTFGYLRDIGITLKVDGTLQLDEAKLDEVVANGTQDLSLFFGGTTKDGGLAGKLGKSLDLMLKSDGSLDSATSGLESSIKSLDQRYANVEKSIESTIERYRKQFAQLDGMLSSMNQMSGYLMQQFDMMNAQLGKG